jgi:integrase
MASITRYKGGWRAHVCVGRVRDSKLWRTRSAAQAWAAEREKELAGGGEKGQMLFEVAAQRFLDIKLRQLSNADNQRTYEQSIRDHALPKIGKKKLCELNRQVLVGVVRDIADAGKLETAHRVGQRICAILDYAVDCGEIDSHAGAKLSRVLPATNPQPMPAIAPADLPELLRAISTYGEPVTRIALLLLAHTFVRTSELIGAMWTEIRGDLWVIPEERMKLRIRHVVPISPQVRALLDELEPMTGDGPFWLSSTINRNLPLSNNTLLFALYRLGYRGRMTGHGFRAVASTVLNESGLWSRDAIERQLAHKETDEVRAAYNRAEFLEERKRLMAWWSAYLEASASKTAE